MSRLGILVAAGLGLVAIGAGLVTDMPDVAGALRELVHALGPWTYAVVAALVLLEAMAILGLVSPGEAVLAVGGAAAAHGAVELPAIIAAAWAAAVVGDATGFWLGRRYGRALLVHTGRHVGICAERLARLERLILRWGGAALVGGRFVGVVRAFTPFLAGASGMPLRRVIGFSIAGAGAWCAAFIVAGYCFAASLESHLDAAGNVALALAGGLVLALLLAHQGANQGDRRMWRAHSDGTLQA